MNSFDLEVTLLQEVGYETEEGKLNKKVKYKEIELLAYENPLTRADLILAGQSNLEITKAIVIHTFEYSNEQLIKIENINYQVVSLYKISNEELELKLKVKKGLKQ